MVRGNIVHRLNSFLACSEFEHCQAPGLMESWLAGFQGCGDRVGHRV
jgi:hypothetical protein